MDNRIGSVNRAPVSHVKIKFKDPIRSKTHPAVYDEIKRIREERLIHDSPQLKKREIELQKQLELHKRRRRLATTRRQQK
jgi:hypothetical protein